MFFPAFIGTECLIFARRYLDFFFKSFLLPLYLISPPLVNV